MNQRALLLVVAGGLHAATLATFQVPEAEQREAVALVQSLKKEIVEQRRGIEPLLVSSST